MVGGEVLEHRLLLGDALGVPVERGMRGQVPVLVRIILDAEPDSRWLANTDTIRTSEEAIRAASAATTRSAVSTRCAPTSPSASVIRADNRSRRRTVRSERPSPPNRASPSARCSTDGAGARPFQVEPNADGQGQHPHGVGRRGAVDHDVVPVARLRQLCDRVQAEYLLDAGKAESSSGAISPRSRLGELPSGPGAMPAPSGPPAGPGVQGERVRSPPTAPRRPSPGCRHRTGSRFRSAAPARRARRPGSAPGRWRPAGRPSPTRPPPPRSPLPASTSRPRPTSEEADAGPATGVDFARDSGQPPRPRFFQVLPAPCRSGGARPCA